jgi:hypothetical protein
MGYVVATTVQVGDILMTGETVTSVFYPVEGDRVEIVTDDGNRVLWNSYSMVEVR